jgi:hypothetical protein
MLRCIRLKYRRCTLFHSAGDECANTFAHLLGGFGHHLMGVLVQVARHGMRESLAGPTTFAAVTFCNHADIVSVLWPDRPACCTRLVPPRAGCSSGDAWGTLTS